MQSRKTGAPFLQKREAEGNTKHLQEKYGQPFLHIPEIPLGAELLICLKKFTALLSVESNFSHKVIKIQFTLLKQKKSLDYSGGIFYKRQHLSLSVQV